MTDFLHPSGAQSPDALNGAWLRTQPLIELRLWRQFLAVADGLHFGRAAQRLNMTQPPLTQAIAQLESVLGLRLFYRTKRSVQITAAGAALVPQVRELLARAYGLPASARATADGQAGRLRLAFVSTVGFALLPQWVRTFRQQYPQVMLELIEATGDVQVKLLERGEIDAGFMLHSPGFAPAGLERQLIASERLLVVMPSQHALSEPSTLTLSRVLDEPLVLFPRRIVPSLHDAVFGMYHSLNRLPQVVQEAIQMQTIVNLVSAGLGIAWVPESVRQFHRSGVLYREVTTARGSAVPVCETSVVWSEACRNPVLQRFVAFIGASAR